MNGWRIAPPAGSARPLELAAALAGRCGPDGQIYTPYEALPVRTPHNLVLVDTVAAAQATQWQFVQVAAQDGMRVHAMHFPWPSLGRMTCTGGIYSWNGVDSPPNPADLRLVP